MFPMFTRAPGFDTLLAEKFAGHSMYVPIKCCIQHRYMSICVTKINQWVLMGSLAGFVFSMCVLSLTTFSARLTYELLLNYSSG